MRSPGGTSGPVNPCWKTSPKRSIKTGISRYPDTFCSPPREKSSVPTCRARTDMKRLQRRWPPASKTRGSNPGYNPPFRPTVGQGVPQNRRAFRTTAHLPRKPLPLQPTSVHGTRRKRAARRRTYVRHRTNSDEHPRRTLQSRMAGRLRT